MPHNFSRFLLVAAFAAPLAFAESEPAAEAEDNEPFPILSATCEDIYDFPLPMSGSRPTSARTAPVTSSPVIRSRSPST